MLEKLAGIEERFCAIEARLSSPDLYHDPAEAAKLLKEQKELTPVVDAYRAYRRAEQAAEDSRELLSGDDPDLRELAEEELREAQAEMQRRE